MSIVSHLHHLFNLETCQAYIHPLRWKDRPLQCPRCHSLNVGPWGTYHAQPGLKRYRCKEKGCTDRPVLGSEFLRCVGHCLRVSSLTQESMQHEKIVEQNLQRELRTHTC